MSEIELTDAERVAIATSAGLLIDGPSAPTVFEAVEKIITARLDDQ